MSLAELIPVVRSLSRDEQIELKQFLDSELCGQESSDADATKAKCEEDLMRQLAAAAPFYRDPVEITADGLLILEQLLAEAGSKDT